MQIPAPIRNNNKNASELLLKNAPTTKNSINKSIPLIVKRKPIFVRQVIAFNIFASISFLFIIPC